MFKRIDHVEIVTDQLHRTVQFYTEVLGFTVKAGDRIERSGLGVPIDLVYLDLGGTLVELISYEGTQVQAAPETEHLGYRMIAIIGTISAAMSMTRFARGKLRGGLIPGMPSSTPNMAPRPTTRILNLWV